MTTLSTTETISSFTLITGEVYTIEGKTFVARKPKGFRGGFDEELACPHRDCSVCPECANRYANIIEVYGVDYAEWVETIAEFARSAVEAKAEREAREARGFSCYQMRVEGRGWLIFHPACYESAGFTEGSGLWYATGLETCDVCHKTVERDNMGDD